MKNEKPCRESRAICDATPPWADVMHVADPRPVRPKGRFLFGPFFDLQPIHDLPVPDDVVTAMRRIRDHYFDDASNDYAATGSSNPDHILLWLTVLAQWLCDYFVYTTEPDGYVQSIPSNPHVTISINHVLLCLRHCDLELVANQSKDVGTRSTLEKCLDDIQKWLVANGGFHDFPEQYRPA